MNDSLCNQFGTQNASISLLEQIARIPQTLFASWIGRISSDRNVNITLQVNIIAMKTGLLEVAVLDIIHGNEIEFEAAFRDASTIISSMTGYISHQLQRCIENRSRYILLVNWQTLEDHTVGFRTSPQYREWKKLLHHFYSPFPTVEHFELVLEQNVCHDVQL